MDKQTMDRGLWITWYDLPDQGREDYLNWLHKTYIPEISGRPGFLWGAHYTEVEKKIGTSATKHTDDPAVPTGRRYILLFGAECAEVFGDPLPSEINAALPGEGRKMLAMRLGERVNIMAEYGRVEGPEAKSYKAGMLPPNCIQLGTYNTDWQNEEDLLAYYAQGRLKNMRVMPGCVRTRKLVSVVGWAKHGVLYEFTSVEARDKNFVGHQDNDPRMKSWTERMVPKLLHAPASANLAYRIWPPMSA
jgi:hypothetical protein